MTALLIKKIIQYTWRPYILWYLKKERNFYFPGSELKVKLKIKPGVFHPGFFFSSLMLVEFISEKAIQNKKLLELGAGAGLLSIVAAKKGAEVTATDISNTSVENIILNAEENKVVISVYRSDLFKSIPENTFDLISVNPPYYKKKPCYGI